MARGRKPKNNNGVKLGFEEQLWAMADALRDHMDVSDLIFPQNSIVAYHRPRWTHRI